jgi:thymidylate kinase
LRRRIHDGGLGEAFERPIRSDSRNLLCCAEAGLQGSELFTPRERELAVLLDAIRVARSGLHAYTGHDRLHAFVSFHFCALLARQTTLTGAKGLRQLLDFLPLPDLSVRLVVPPDVALQRVRARPQGDQLLTEADPATAIKARIDAFERAGEAIPYPQTILDGTLPTDALVTALMPALRAHRI